LVGETGQEHPNPEHPRKKKGGYLLLESEGGGRRSTNALPERPKGLGKRGGKRGTSNKTPQTVQGSFTPERVQQMRNYERIHKAPISRKGAERTLALAEGKEKFTRGRTSLEGRKQRKTEDFYWANGQNEGKKTGTPVHDSEKKKNRKGFPRFWEPKKIGLHQKRKRRGASAL